MSKLQLSSLSESKCNPMRARRERGHWMERDASLREFLDALTERHVTVTQAMIDAINGLQVEISDQREQIQANTQAVLRLIDERFGPEPPQG